MDKQIESYEDKLSKNKEQYNLEINSSRQKYDEKLEKKK